MPSEDAMRAAMQAYIDTFNRADLDALTGLYADDATVTDPVGSPTLSGKQAITEFYAGALKTGAKLRLSAPIRASHDNAAAMAFEVDLDLEDGRFRIHVIDVMTFNENGQFQSMHAYWGPSDMQPL